MRDGMVQDAKAAALAALDETAAQLADADERRAEVMRRLRANVVAADRVGVDRTTIIARSGVSRPTVYQILNETGLK